MPDPVTGTIAAATVASGAMGAKASKSAARAQERASDEATQLQREMFERQTELQEPFRQAGITGQNELMRLLGLAGEPTSAGYGSLAKPFTMADFQADPGYAFRMSEGLKALDRTAAARGGLLSGATLRGAQRYGQELGSQEYMNAFNRYQAERAARLSPLQSLFGAGQTTAAELGRAGQQFGAQAGENILGAANARASGYVGSANAWNQALAGATNAYLQNQMINRLIPPTGVPTTPNMQAIMRTNQAPGFYSGVRG